MFIVDLQFQGLRTTVQELRDLCAASQFQGVPFVPASWPEEPFLFACPPGLEVYDVPDLLSAAVLPGTERSSGGRSSLNPWQVAHDPCIQHDNMTHDFTAQGGVLASRPSEGSAFGPCHGVHSPSMTQDGTSTHNAQGGVLQSMISDPLAHDCMHGRNAQGGVLDERSSLSPRQAADKPRLAQDNWRYHGQCVQASGVACSPPLGGLHSQRAPGEVLESRRTGVRSSHCDGPGSHCSQDLGGVQQSHCPSHGVTALAQVAGSAALLSEATGAPEARPSAATVLMEVPLSHSSLLRASDCAGGDSTQSAPMGSLLRAWAGLQAQAGLQGQAEYSVCSPLQGLSCPRDASGSWGDGSRPLILQADQGSATACRILYLTQPAFAYYTEPGAAVFDALEFFCWDPLGRNESAFWQEEHVLWTEPSSGQTATGTELISLCDDLRCEILLDELPPDQVIRAASVILQAEADLFRHLSGWSKATECVLRDHLDVLRRVSGRVLGLETMSDDDVDSDD